ncbi:hypothetical protein DAPPUDRAFT_317279 [Daphnia pulex]|uniref:Uncharacterized protein n=1 Tax=Daphnia pulex TaxID=6669 RepID=E9GFH8_DAPPU|nr:hypothetical protein DAPPUDRAFT_317279 [Daphnia pulex]|eukprot:EFX81810.1 hypothetical protein DAPPUDRAFT_317279 [Daphnia pulex]
MDASPTSTHFNYHTTSPVHQSNFYTEDKAVILVHVPCLQVIPVISAPGHQCLVSELMKGKTPSWLVSLPVIQNAFLFTAAYYKATANVTMMIDNWRAALECDRLSGLKALLNRFLWGNFVYNYTS